MSTILMLIIGAFIGWNFPQPAYAKAAQAWVVNLFKGFGSSNNDSGSE